MSRQNSEWKNFVDFTRRILFAVRDREKGKNKDIPEESLSVESLIEDIRILREQVAKLKNSAKRHA